MNKLSQNHAVFARADWKAVDADLEYRIDQLRKEIMNKDTEIFQLMKQREELDLQFSCAFKEKEELLNQRNTESHLLKSVGDELASISSQLDASNEVMEIEQDGIKREVDGLREDLAKYKSELSRRQRAVEIMNAQTQHYRNENDRLDGLQTEMEDKCRQLQQKVKDSEKVLGVPIKAIQRTKIELGKGAYGDVYLGTWETSTVAVKIYLPEAVRESYMGSLFQSEIVRCAKLHHEHIAHVYGFNRVKNGVTIAIMEVLQGSLSDVLLAAQSCGQYLTLREQLDITQDCLEGLNYLHQLPHQVCHCDIRPTNILLTADMKAKLSDLGEARLTDQVLVRDYVSPERGEHRPLTPATDVFSMGLTMCELFTGIKATYKLGTREALLKAVEHSVLYDICSQMMFRTYTMRISVVDALRGVEHVMDTPDYWNCPSKRFVKGKVNGAVQVTLIDKPDAW